jgi:hypothetical protein
MAASGNTPNRGTYVLHKLPFHKEPSSEHINHAVLLYPDPNGSSSSTGTSIYKACFILQDTLLADENNKLIEVSMGNLSPEEIKLHAELIKKALEKAYKTLIDANLEVPTPIIEYLVSTHEESQAPLIEMAHKQQDALHKKFEKQDEEQGEAKDRDFPNKPTIQPQASQVTFFGRPSLDSPLANVTPLGNMISRVKKTMSK